MDQHSAVTSYLDVTSLTATLANVRPICDPVEVYKPMRGRPTSDSETSQAHCATWIAKLAAQIVQLV